MAFVQVMVCSMDFVFMWPLEMLIRRWFIRSVQASKQRFVNLVLSRSSSDPSLPANVSVAEAGQDAVDLADCISIFSNFSHINNHSLEWMYT